MILTDTYYAEPIQPDLFLSREKYLLELSYDLQDDINYYADHGQEDLADLLMEQKWAIYEELDILLAVNGPNH